MPDPVILRAYNAGHKGATAFFRNRPFLEALFAALRSVAGERITILAHACSLGAEPYSLALWWLHQALPAFPRKTSLEVVATDVDAEFLAYARRAQYPVDVLRGMTAREQSWFVRKSDTVCVPDKARRLVRFTEPTDFVREDPPGEFDVILIMNALTYVSQEQQSAALARCAQRCRHLLGVTAFHPDSIESDVTASGFSPCTEKHREIHEAWGDRLAKGEVSADRPDYSWRLPPYERESADFEYRYGALFRRDGVAAQPQDMPPGRSRCADAFDVESIREIRRASSFSRDLSPALRVARSGFAMSASDLCTKRSTNCGSRTETKPSEFSIASNPEIFGVLLSITRNGVSRNAAAIV